MTRSRKDLARMGIDDFVARRLEYFAPFVAGVVLVCAPFALIGYAVAPGKSFGDSTGAGIGLLLGLVVWLGVFIAFIANGGAAGLRERRQARRHQQHVERIRQRSRDR